MAFASADGACASCGSPRAPLMCGRCRLAAYCAVPCQARDYKRFHRAECHAAVRDATFETVLRLCAAYPEGAAVGTRDGSVLAFLRQDEALELRAASRTCREAVAEHGWSDWFIHRSIIKRDVVGWRKCFPLARAAMLDGIKTLADADFLHLLGVCKVSIEGCNQAAITDAAFAHLRGIHTLDMSDCKQATITDAAFAHLRGIHTLDMGGCNQATITDVAIMHLRGIHTLSLWRCTQITDAALVHLAGIHTLWLNGCAQLTDAALVHLVGIRTLHFAGCPQLTDAALGR